MSQLEQAEVCSIDFSRAQITDLNGSPDFWISVTKMMMVKGKVKFSPLQALEALRVVRG
jgi:hypothetical protein